MGKMIQLPLSIRDVGLVCNWGMSISASVLSLDHRQRIQNDVQFLIAAIFDELSIRFHEPREVCETWLKCPFCAGRIWVYLCDWLRRAHDDRVQEPSYDSPCPGILEVDVER